MSSASRPLNAGDQLGPYRIVRTLGMGGMGTVFEAVDVGLNRRVALKVIASALAGDPTFRARFTQEAQAQASLDSPHVVTVFAYGEVEGRLYIATQLIPDGDLGAMFATHGAPPPRIAVAMIAQVAAGLAEAHRVGLVHRDIKPANVLIRNHGDSVSAYLADFGIARRVDGGSDWSGLTTDGFAIGTPTYMAPELHTGATPGPRTDVYSLGCLLWACLVGRAPYGGTTDYQVVSAHVSAPVPQLAGTGAFEREMNRILRTALAKEPAQRYQSATALRDDLRRLEQSISAPDQVVAGPGSPTAATAPQPSYQQYRPAGLASTGAREAAASGASGGARVGLIVAALAVVVLLVGGGIGAAVLLSNGDEADPSADPATSAAASTSGGATDPTRSGGATDPTDAPVSDDPSLDDEEDQVVANLTEALVADGDIDRPTATCVSTKLVEKRGVDGLQAAGFIDEDLQVVQDASGEPDPTLLTDVFSLAFDCALSSADF